jgi:hypothetical protein
MNDNQIVIKAYSTGTTEIYGGGLDKAQDLTFSHQYPGGMCNSMTFFVPRDITSTWTLQGAQRITAWNGFHMVWEGYVASIAPTLSGGAQGMAVTCAGAWAWLLMNRKTQKPWADTRLDNNAWAEATAAADANDISLLKSCQIDRTNRIRFTPSSIRDAAGAEKGWANGNYVRVIYTAPTGQTIKRITLDYDLQEGAQAWELNLYSVTGATNLLNRTASNATPGTRVSWDSGTIATPTQSVFLIFKSGAAQTPATDGTMYGDVANVVVYTEVGNINAQEIIKDIAAMVSPISTDLTKIGAETLSLVPFISDPPQTLADEIAAAATTGDTSFNRWGYYVGFSSDFSDGKPGLVLEQVPALTDYDYALRVDDKLGTGGLSFSQDFDAIRNWIGVQYQDTTGRPVYVTPDDDAALKDASSITNYGQRELWLTLPTTSLANAKYQAGRWLAMLKDPQWKATGTITVAGSIRAKSGQPVPASQILPGKRVKIENWLNDLSGAGLTFLISGTDYTDNGQTCAMTIGKPDPTEFIVARMQKQLDQQRLMSNG